MCLLGCRHIYEVPKAGMKDEVRYFHLTVCVGCDYLSLPLIQTLKLSPRNAWMTQLRKLVSAVWKIYQWVFNSTGIDQSHKSYNALAPYPTMHHTGAKMWIYVCLNVMYFDIKERCIVRFCPFLFQHGFLWDNGQMHWGICAIVPSSDWYDWPITRSVTIYFPHHCLYRFIRIFKKKIWCRCS